jgi:hypothetical protein
MESCRCENLKTRRKGETIWHVVLLGLTKESGFGSTTFDEFMA